MQRRGKHFYVTIEDLLGRLSSVGAALSLYNEDPRLSEIELRESLKIAVEDD
jgi:hypothetical protein